MKKWNLEDALMAVKKSGAEVRGKSIIVGKDGLKGLTGCSALDYLVNYCGYRN